jgi:hypothetical protein
VSKSAGLSPDAVRFVVCVCGDEHAQRKATVAAVPMKTDLKFFIILESKVIN